MFTVVFEQRTMLQWLADLLKMGDLPSIMTTNKQMHTDLGNCRTRWWGCTRNKVLAARRRLWQQRRRAKAPDADRGYKRRWYSVSEEEQRPADASLESMSTIDVEQRAIVRTFRGRSPVGQENMHRTACRLTHNWWTSNWRLLQHSR